jgi:hypothetical protein
MLKKRKRKPQGEKLEEGLSEPCSKKEIRSVILKGKRCSGTISCSSMAYGDFCNGGGEFLKCESH